MSALLLMDGTRDETSSTSNKPVVVSNYRVHVVILLEITLILCMCMWFNLGFNIYGDTMLHVVSSDDNEECRTVVG